VRERHRLLVGLAALALATAVAGVVVIAGSRTTARLGIPAAHSGGTTPATPTPGPAADPLAAACGRPPADATGPGISGTWSVGPGSEAGFRAREKFAQIATPHEAVARTDRLAGWITVRVDGPAIELTGACIAVELGSLHSVDTVPGLNTRDRDSAARDLLNVADHPFARFAVATPASLPAALASEAGGATALAGALEINGVSRAVTATLQARTGGGQVLAAGSATVLVEDYGVEVPKAADFIVVDSHVTLELALVLQRP